MYELTVIIPTFNEASNIKKMILAVDTVFRQNFLKGQLLVVDDHSPDGTSEIVRELQQSMPNLSLLCRERDPGLSESVVDGLNHAMSPISVIIDADFSHPPELIPKMYRETLHGNDIVIGSRYMAGGGIKKWPLKRRIISKGATFLGRLLFPDITDPVSGFFAIKRNVVVGAQLRPRGYKILLEILGKGEWNSVKELPYEFVNRQEGSSKLTPKVICEYAFQVWDILRHSLSLKRGAVWEECKKLVKFGLVGISGIFVNLAVLFILVEFGWLSKEIASLLAIEISILTNFVGNDLWTFSGVGGDDPTFLEIFIRLASFNLISAGGALINYMVFILLTGWLSVYYLLAQFIGILVAFGWNFIINRRLTWGKKTTQPNFN